MCNCLHSTHVGPKSSNTTAGPAGYRPQQLLCYVLREVKSRLTPSLRLAPSNTVSAYVAPGLGNFRTHPLGNNGGYSPLSKHDDIRFEEDQLKSMILHPDIDQCIAMSKRIRAMSTFLVVISAMTSSALLSKNTQNGIFKWSRLSYETFHRSGPRTEP